MRHTLRPIVMTVVLISGLLNPSWIIAADPTGPAPLAGAPAVDPDPSPNAASSLAPANLNAALLQILVSKGILTSGEANSLGSANSAAGTQQLLLLLKQKGLLSDSDLASLQGGIPEQASNHMVADIRVTDSALTAQVAQTAPAKPKEAPAGPVVIPAVAPDTSAACRSSCKRRRSSRIHPGPRQGQAIWLH